MWKYDMYLIIVFPLFREKYQKVRSPVPRNKTDFDAGAKFHVPSDYPYVAYYVAHILEFQILKSLCIAAGQYEPQNPQKPLYKCDIEGSKLAGERLRAGLSLGSSKHWSETLSIITNGEHEMSADAILEYFKPLYEFLVEENKKAAESKLKIEWNALKYCIAHEFTQNFSFDSFIVDKDEFTQSKLWYVLGGFAVLVAVVSMISYGIYYINRK